MEVKKIYFDMDGVLADFERGVKELCGLVPPSQNGKRKQGADDEMWLRIKGIEHFYDKLELMPGAKDIVVNIVYREDKKDYCTGADCILIDDMERNIKAWETCGGTGIVHRSVDETLEKLKSLDIL